MKGLFRAYAVQMAFCFATLTFFAQAAPAQHQILVHVLSPAFNEGGDTLSFGVGVYEPLNLAEVRAGHATEIEYQQILNGEGLIIAYKVSSKRGTFNVQDSLPFSPNLFVHVPVGKWDGRGVLQIEVFGHGDGWEDVTNIVNSIPTGHLLPYGQASLRRAVMRAGNFGYLSVMGRWVRASLKKGGAISYILLIVFLWGLVVSGVYIARLFLSPKWSIKSIRSPNLDMTLTEGGLSSLSTLQEGGMSPAERVTKEVLRRARRIEREWQGGVIHLKDIRALESLGFALTEQISDELVGEQLRMPIVRNRFTKIVNWLPSSLESLWNAAVVAPLLGLLGTVVGISSAFGSVRFIAASQDPGVAMSQLSKGINKALYTTVHGLVVGIFLMLIFYLCTRRARRIQQEFRQLGESIYRKYLLEIANRRVRVVE